MRISGCTSVLLVFTLAGNAVPQDGRVEWAGFKEGSWVQRKHVVKNDGKEEDSFTEKIAIKSIKRDSIIFETETTRAGQEPERTESTLRLNADLKSKKVREEELEIDGTKFNCEVRELTSDVSKSMLWVCADAKIPDHVLKAEGTVEITGGQKEVRLKVAKFSEKITLSGKTLDCWVRETQSTQPGLTQKVTEWKCRQVPGLLVKSVCNGTFDLSEPAYVIELVAYENK